MMDHDDIQQLLPAYLDQELGMVDALAVERHLATCLACQRALDEQRHASLRLRAGGAYVAAPAALRARVSAALPAAPAPAANGRATAWWRIGWPQLAVAAAVVLALGWGISAVRMAASEARQGTEALVTSHIRSLQVDHLADVASSDQHTVKPWFVGKLDFAPPVVDLAPQGYPLVGGRLDYLDGRAVAVLVYRRNRHPINLYIWPDAASFAPPQATQWHGYHLLRWHADNMQFSAVSDAAAGDLAQFAQLVRAHAMGP